MCIRHAEPVEHPPRKSADLRPSPVRAPPKPQVLGKCCSRSIPGPVPDIDGNSAKPIMMRNRQKIRCFCPQTYQSGYAGHANRPMPISIHKSYHKLRLSSRVRVKIPSIIRENTVILIIYRRFITITSIVSYARKDRTHARRSFPCISFSPRQQQCRRSGQPRRFHPRH